MWAYPSISAPANNKGKCKVKKKSKGMSKVKKNVENKNTSSKEKSSDMPITEEEPVKADTIQSLERSSGSRSAATGAHKPDHSEGEDMEDSSKSSEDIMFTRHSGL